MESFEEWLTDCSGDHPCLTQWSERLLELGASWDTFHSDDEQSSSNVVDDLVQGGIPLLAARDICRLASRAIAQSSRAPLAIFWDLENMPIPSTISGREVATRLKTVVAPHGDLVQFRAYANIGLGLIPQQKRSDLQLSNCHLVDCPHSGRKEVADKMIIVDAMQFAFTHPEGATLCFVTGDVDYAYLLAVLQKPQWKTVVISKGTMQSMLHVNCDMKMRWETDVLQLRSIPLPPSSAPPGFPQIERTSDTRFGTPTATKPPFHASSVERVDDSSQAGTTCHDVKTVVVEGDDAASALSVEALTIAEEWADDAELLRTIVREAPEAPSAMASEGVIVSEVGRAHFARKSHVGNTLRQTNPARFPDRQAVKDFLAKAVETGIVIESGEGAFKTFRLPSGGDQAASFLPVIALSETAPVAAQEMPLRALQMISTLPFVLFAPWMLCPKEDKFPPKTFIQSSGKWAVLMFPTLTTAQRAVAGKPWLRSGTLVDWRRASHLIIPSVPAAHNAMELVPCALCKDMCQKSLMANERNDDGLYCQSCCSLVGITDKLFATGCVKDLLEMMAENDDIYIAENILRKQLCLRWPSACISRQHAALWVQDAVETGVVMRYKRPDIKSKLICLTRFFQLAMTPFPSADIDTSEEEKHLVNMLWERHGWMKRTEAIESLKENFEAMQSPLLRNKCVLNAAVRKRFFVAKGGWGQTLGLTLEDAQKALRIAYPSSETAAADTSGSQDHSLEASGNGDETAAHGVYDANSSSSASSMENLSSQECTSHDQVEKNAIEDRSVEQK